MSNTLYNGSICLTDIPKDKITVSPKNGKSYLSIDIWIDTEKEPDDFGNVAGVTVQQTKAEREAKAKRQYIGNLKKPFADKPAAATTATAVPANEAKAYNNDLPF